MPKDPFTWWYSLTTIARRLGKSPLTIRRAIDAGKFGARPGEPGFPGRQICGQWHLPWSAVALFLGVSAEVDSPVTTSFRARSEGELRRKLTPLSVVQTPGQEAIHG